MAAREPTSKSLGLLGSLTLIGLGGLGVLVTTVALVGLVLEGRFTWANANASIILWVCSAVVLGFGLILYRRAQR